LKFSSWLVHSSVAVQFPVLLAHLTEKIAHCDRNAKQLEPPNGKLNYELRTVNCFRASHFPSASVRCSIFSNGPVDSGLLHEAMKSHELQVSRFPARAARFDFNARKLPHPARRPNGFTLMELLIVMAIIAILMLIAIPTVGSLKKNANDLSAIQSIRAIQQAEMQYSESTYPANGFACTLPPGRRPERRRSLGHRRADSAGRPHLRLQVRLHLHHQHLPDKVTVNGVDRVNSYTGHRRSANGGQTGDAASAATSRHHQVRPRRRHQLHPAPRPMSLTGRCCSRQRLLISACRSALPIWIAGFLVLPEGQDAPQPVRA
jgi:prepilin-type N-terminal cleavage/methylation domain-containing protein